ncbi:MAG: hypothetical protein WDA20_01090 [Desulfuromonadales bacterium]
MAEYQDWQTETTTGVKKMGGDGKGIHEGAQKIMEEGRRRGKGILEEQKKGVSNSVQRFSSALEKAARDLEEDQPLAASIFHNGAQTLDKVSRTLQDRDAETLYRQVQDFARRQPALMLGGAFVGGFILLRLLKSSPERGESGYQSAETELETASPVDPFSTGPEGFTMGAEIKEEKIYGSE